MTEVTKRKRRRQEYVKTKTTRLLRLAFVILAVLGLWAAGVIAVIPFFMQWRNPPRPFTIPVEVGFLLIPFGIVAYGAWRMLKRAEWDFEMVAYAPPITPKHSLPDDEILVRGSEAPTLQSKVLLRAAKSGETPKDELLRVCGE
jgi:hypothetical protein